MTPTHPLWIIRRSINYLQRSRGMYCDMKSYLVVLIYRLRLIEDTDIAKKRDFIAKCNFWSNRPSKGLSVPPVDNSEIREKQLKRSMRSQSNVFLNIWVLYTGNFCKIRYFLLFSIPLWEGSFLVSNFLLAF